MEAVPKTASLFLIESYLEMLTRGPNKIGKSLGLNCYKDSREGPD